MIRRLQLKNWRAFAELDLTLDEGVTFVVAENSVGKTSLVEAAAWGIFGARSGIDGTSARRKDGDDPGSVSVEMELPDGRILSIMRRTDRPEAPAVSLDDAAAPDDLDDLLREGYGAEVDYLARVTVLPTDLLRGYADESFHLRKHLCRVYGVDSMESAVDATRRYLKALASETKTVRSGLQTRIQDENALSERLSQLQHEKRQLETERDQLRALIASAERRQALTALAAEASEANRAREAALSALCREALQALGLSADAVSLITVLTAEDDRVAAELDSVRRERSAAEGRLDGIHAALEDLRSADADCPVCRRPLAAGDRAHAETVHSTEMSALSGRVQQLATTVADLTSRQSTVRDLRRRVETVPALVESPVPPDEAVPETPHVEALHERMAEVADLLGTTRATETQVEHLLSDSIAARDEQAQAIRLYRREALATMLVRTLERTVEALLANRVEPVAREVSARWKRVFPERGSLELSPDGELSMTRGSVTVPFEDFSAGEKVVALLTARLLIVSASTRASYMWLDEPLEHLDPANRRIVASLLATATAPVRQVLVTTYEEPLARRLAEQVPSVHLVYVRSSPD